MEQEVTSLLKSMGFEYIDTFETDDGFVEYLYEKGDITVSFIPEKKRIVVTAVGSVKAKKKLPKTCRAEKGDHSIIVFCNEEIPLNGGSLSEVKERLEKILKRFTRAISS